MAVSVKKLLGRRGALVAAVTAGGVAAFLLLSGVLQQLIGLLAYGGGDLSGVVTGPAIRAVPFAVGYFIALWIIAPITEELRIGHVITRAVLATGVGATVSFIVQGVLGLVSALAWSSTLSGNPYLFPAFDAEFAVRSLANALTGSLALFLATLALGVLAGVLLWLWRKDHPSEHPLSGLIDEV